MSGQLAQGQHPETGRLITFRDCRPQAQAGAETQEDAAGLSGLVAPRILVTMRQVAKHEARHAAVALFLGFNVIEARADAPAGKALGHVLFDHSGERPWDRLRYAAMLTTLVAGGLGEKGWPPAWPLDPNGAEDDERQLAAIVDRLGLNEKQFNGLVGVTGRLVEHPFLKRLQDAISTPLSIGMTLKRPMLKVMYEVTEREWVEEHRERTPEERAHATEVERHREWMSGVLKAGARHARSRELRRQCFELAREFKRTRSLP